MNTPTDDRMIVAHERHRLPVLARPHTERLATSNNLSKSSEHLNNNAHQQHVNMPTHSDEVESKEIVRLRRELAQKDEQLDRLRKQKDEQLEKLRSGASSGCKGWGCRRQTNIGGHCRHRSPAPASEDEIVVHYVHSRGAT